MTHKHTDPAPPATFPDPAWKDDLPWCEHNCRAWDGRRLRCTLTRRPVYGLCEPQIRALLKEHDVLRKKLREATP